MHLVSGECGAYLSGVEKGLRAARIKVKVIVNYDSCRIDDADMARWAAIASVLLLVQFNLRDPDGDHIHIDFDAAEASKND